MALSYSVMNDPVIPVIFHDGSISELGIREILIRAHEIRDLQCPSPLERYAFFRLLVAFAMDILRPARWTDRRALLDTGQLNADAVDAYIAACETDGPRFDLFDPVHPFMQSAYDAGIDEKAIKPVANLSVSLPSGNNHVFLDHRMETLPVMTPAEAFRAMIALYVFCTAGAQGYPSGVNNTPPVYNRVIGSTLYDTIILNMCSTQEHPYVPDGYEDLPWKNGIPVIPKQGFAEVSMSAAFTWKPRRICLLPDDDGMIRKVALQQGNDFKGNDLWRDPHVAYRSGKKGEWNSIKPQSGRALWRDVGALLADTANEHYRPPMTVSRAPDLYGTTSKPLIIQQIGVITNNAAYVGWVEDQVSLPCSFFEDEFLASIIREDTLTSETMQSILVRSINSHYSHGAKQDIGLAEQARLSFLTQMHDILFTFCVPDVYGFRENMTTENIRNHIHCFNQQTEKAILNTLREIVQASGSMSGDLLLQVEIQREVLGRFRKLIAEREESYE